MKKRLLSLLLTVATVAALFAGLVISADAADGPSGTFLVNYTVKAGDSIYGICQDKDIDFNTNWTKICQLSNVLNPNYMFPGTKLWLPSTAADTSAPYYNVHKYTVASGDSLASICQNYGGVDYNRDQRLIRALNPNLEPLIAGKTILLPVYVTPPGYATPTPSAAPTPSATPAPTSSGTYTGVITEVTGSSITVGGITFGIRGADLTGTPAVGSTATVTYTAVDGVFTASKVVVTNTPTGATSYYLVQHVLQYGETVSGVCAALGIDFAANSDKIMKINGIVSYNYLLPGKVLLLPTTTMPTSGSYYKVVGHKVQAGDTVYGLCLSYGLNYYTYSKLIQAINGGRNLTSFYVGEMLYLPFYIAAPSVGPTAAPTGSPTTAPTGAPTPTPAPSGAPSGSPTATPSAAPTGSPLEGDTLAYLLATHVLQYGETVSGVCAALGVDFLSNSDKIAKLSGIVSYNYLLPGKTLLIPVTEVPASGSYYKIYAHTLKAGETVYDLCISYGLDYLSNVKFLQALNGRDNLASFYVGETVYLPILVQQ